VVQGKTACFIARSHNWHLCGLFTIVLTANAQQDGSY
jgi:hypothetical protein